MPFVSRTRATLRSAEFGFFGVVVYTRVHTPRRCGAASRFLRPWPDLRPGVATFFLGFLRPFRTSWLMLGTARDPSSGFRPRGAPGVRLCHLRRLVVRPSPRNQGRASAASPAAEEGRPRRLRLPRTRAAASAASPAAEEGRPRRLRLPRKDLVGVSADYQPFRGPRRTLRRGGWRFG